MSSKLPDYFDKPRSLPALITSNNWVEGNPYVVNRAVTRYNFVTGIA